VKIAVHSALDGSPPEFCIHLSRLSGPLVAGTTFPRDFGALQRYPWSSPIMKRAFKPLLGSAHGFSQPLSGFRTTKFHGLISCRNRSWTTSLQSLPLVKIAHPFRGRWLPCSYPPCRRNAPPTTLLLTVSPTPTLLTQSPGSPASYGLPFDRPEDPLSRSP